MLQIHLLKSVLLVLTFSFTALNSTAFGSGIDEENNLHSLFRSTNFREDAATNSDGIIIYRSPLGREPFLDSHQREQLNRIITNLSILLKTIIEQTIIEQSGNIERKWINDLILRIEKFPKDVNSIERMREFLFFTRALREINILVNYTHGHLNHYLSLFVRTYLDAIAGAFTQEVGALLDTGDSIVYYEYAIGNVDTWNELDRTLDSQVRNLPTLNCQWVIMQEAHFAEIARFVIATRVHARSLQTGEFYLPQPWRSYIDLIAVVGQGLPATYSQTGLDSYSLTDDRPTITPASMEEFANQLWTSWALALSLRLFLESRGILLLFQAAQASAF